MAGCCSSPNRHPRTNSPVPASLLRERGQSHGRGGARGPGQDGYVTVIIDLTPVAAMDGFGGYTNAANEQVPEVITVMDPCLLRPPRLQRATEAINARLEALRRNALGFRDLNHYRIRSLLHCGNLAQQM